MYEVEVKVRTAHDGLRDRLESLDADRDGTVRQVDTYYSAPHREFAETDEALRIRQETRQGTTTTELTYKGPRVEAESKTREEIETAVADGEATDGILTALGFDPAATVEKRRERWQYGPYLVVLDSVDGLGEFVEVETDATESLESARDGVYDVFRELGLDPTDQTTTSYLGLLLEDNEP
ncbi:class IV adenylate cyclase [Halobacteriales archaeon Cl-PHB]